MEVDQETVFSPNRHDNSKHISHAQIMWRQNDAQNFREILVSEFIIHSKEENVTATGTSRGRPSSTASQLCRLEGKHFQHWPAKGKKGDAISAYSRRKQGKLCVSARSVTWVSVFFRASRYGIHT
jgi:hypothetical protein